MNREQFPRCSHCNDGRMSVSGDGSNWCDRCEVPQQARAEMVRHKLPDGSVLSVDSRVLVDAMLRLGKAVIAGGPPDDIGPTQEVVEEYYAAHDAVKRLAATLASMVVERSDHCDSGHADLYCPSCGHLREISSI